MSMFDRVFGSCLRNWVWPNETGHQKYIDYLPTRKWRYNDANLMNELTDNNSWDILDLAEDELMTNTTPRNVKLRIHDNVFINPLNPSSENNNDGANSKDLKISADTDVIVENVVLQHGDGEEQQRGDEEDDDEINTTDIQAEINTQLEDINQSLQDTNDETVESS